MWNKIRLDVTIEYQEWICLRIAIKCLNGLGD